MNALLADLKDFLADVPNERGVGDGMKAWAKELLDRMNAASTQNIFDVADHEGMVGDAGVGGSTSYRASSEASTENNRGSSTAHQEREISDSQYSTISQKQRIDAEMRLVSNHSGESPAACRQMFVEELSKFPRATEAQLEQEFVDTGNRLAAKYQKKHWIDAVEWYWRLLAVAVFGAAVYVYGRLAGAW